GGAGRRPVRLHRGAPRCRRAGRSPRRAHPARSVPQDADGGRCSMSGGYSGSATHGTSESRRSSTLDIPALSLVVLVGASGSGKSTFARTHFGPYETLSSDTFRGLVGGDETDQSATKAAFEALEYVAGKRLEAGLLTVIDATSVQREARRSLVQLARAHDVLPVAIVLDLPVQESIERNAGRSDRDIPAGVVKRQHDQLRRGLRHLAKEGFRKVHV